ncbi:catalase/peroxidase HPI [Geoglobus acetivorans]
MHEGKNTKPEDGEKVLFTPEKKKWSNVLNLRVLHQNCLRANPMGDDFDYAKEFEKLDFDEVKKDIKKVLTTSQDWWPADFRHYGPLFIRLAWHSAGTYRIIDGRGGANRGIIRLFPLRSWPDNINLDKAIRLLWPVKKKYGRRISWADLIILAGNVALESMGFKTLGFAGGREDVYEPQEDIYWGEEDEWLESQRFVEDDLEGALAATQMGLIYVNPEGPGGNPDPVEAAKHIRLAFRRMGMNDEETVALIAGGHTFGKCHGAAPQSYLGPEPDAAPVEQQGLGWKNSYRSGKGPDTITSGLELTWTQNPTKWTTLFLKNLFEYDYELIKGPGGAYQWIARDAEENIPDAHDSEKKHRPMMLTTDLALKFDPVYSKIARRFLENPEEFQRAFARAWFKLTHRDLGPPSRYLGPEVPEEQFVWQEPTPKADHELVSDEDVRSLKRWVLESGLSVSDLIYVAWSAASTFRGSDFKGGANGARIRLEPQKSWEVNMPERLEKVLGILREIQRKFNESQSGDKRVSLADLIVLAGCAAVEEAAGRAGFDVSVPFTPGRVDVSLEQTDVTFWKMVEPVADGFRNYFRREKCPYSPEEMLVDKAQLLTLTAAEMTVLVGGLRVLNANYGGTDYGVLSDKPETLTNDFFVNLLDMGIEWRPVSDDRYLFEGYDRKNGGLKWRATRVDLIFGANSQLRAISEIYAADDGKERFVTDFVRVWVRVMNLDRFDLNRVPS